MTINVTLSGEVATRAITYNLSQAAAVEGVATQNAVSSSGFVFFAAFDGTGNTLNNSPVSNNQTTNVSALFNQFTSANAGSTSAVARYYNGMGTPGTIDNSSWLSSSVTAEGISTATRAYNEFAAAASIFLNTPGNAGKSVEAAMTSFSRGDVAAALFSQLVFQNGIIDRANGDKVLVAPGQVGINAGVIFDPVTTGFKGNVSFAPNTKDLVVIRALNEYRTHFEAVEPLAKLVMRRNLIAGLGMMEGRGRPFLA